MNINSNSLETTNEVPLEIIEFFKITAPLIRDRWSKACKSKPLNLKSVDILQRHQAAIFAQQKENNRLQKSQQMAHGIIWQEVIGKFIGWKDLETGHETGLDCIHEEKKIIMELKNSYNTHNSGSCKAFMDKLAKHKKEHPDYRPIWGIVNAKNHISKKEIITHDGQKIEKLQGDELLDMIFTYQGINYKKQIIEHMQNIMYPSV